MPSSRTAREVARFLLAWFALYLGAAVASPLTAAGYAVICSADGTARLVPTDAAGTPGEARATLHCPLCVPASAPPPPATAGVVMPLRPSACPLPSPPAERHAAQSTTPPPARGPPGPA